MKDYMVHLERPLSQMVVLGLFSLVIHILLWLTYSSTDAQNDHFYHWVISASILLLYAFFNAVYLLKTKELKKYIRDALYGFIGLLIFSFGLARIISNISDVDERSIKWIFFTITFSYFIFLTIAYFMRKIIEYAQRQDTEAKS